ncbi:S8 family serine peptidase [Haloarcula halophila]|uniref:S8 family serine peptidase n=1 Tax=Haloarcula TaxID=2237 RepID=UPI0023E3FAD0|nr:S8 family serine peptidase [Halomicroarcula sp. DFY41]
MARGSSPVTVLCLVVLLAVAPAQGTAFGGAGQQSADDQPTGSVADALETAAPASDGAAGERVRVVVRFVSDDARDDASLRETHPEIDITGGRSVDFMPVLFVDAPRSALPGLRARPDVESAVIDTKIEGPDPVTPASTVDAQSGTTQSQRTPWGVDRIGASTAQQQIDDEAVAEVDVAVLDSGIDYQHPDLDEKVVWGANFSGWANERTLASADDDNGHGTRAAGIVAAEDNNRDVVGVAPNADLYAIKVMNASSIGYYSWWVSGIDAALKGPDGTMGTADDADVLSMSIGGRSDTSTLRNAIADASDHTIVVAAAGNNGDGDPSTNEVMYPAKYDDAIAVAATDRDDQTTEFSAEGSEVELAAPGSGQYTTDIGGGTSYFGGTSAAAPHVAGAAALIIGEDVEDGTRDLSNDDVRQRLRETATDIESPGRDNKAGYGLVQVDTALSTPNAAPTADAGSDTSVTAGATVTLDATGSTDPDGDALEYSWDQIDSPSVSLRDANTATPEFTAPTVDSRTTLTFELRVDDGNGGSATDTVDVTVSPSNSAPTADAGPDSSVASDATVTLDATGSTDPDGDSLAYAWSQTGGPAVSLSGAATAQPTFTAPSVRTQTTLRFEVTVQDGSAASTDTVAITVEPPANSSRFDVDGDGTVDREDVMAVITAYNSGSSIGGKPVDVTDVMTAISELNS